MQSKGRRVPKGQQESVIGKSGRLGQLFDDADDVLRRCAAASGDPARVPPLPPSGTQALIGCAAAAMMQRVTSALSGHPTAPPLAMSPQLPLLQPPGGAAGSADAGSPWLPPMHAPSASGRATAVGFAASAALVAANGAPGCCCGASGAREDAGAAAVAASIRRRAAARKASGKCGCTSGDHGVPNSASLRTRASKSAHLGCSGQPRSLDPSFHGASP